ncbi:exosporium leader peptide-containing protein [Bacillus sp. BH2]|nr:exosporium leader peptide-containing protein [Bacillus sp. BH2]
MYHFRRLSDTKVFLDPGTIGPTLPPIPSITFPTGPTGATVPVAAVLTNLLPAINGLTIAIYSHLFCEFTWTSF